MIRLTSTQPLHHPSRLDCSPSVRSRHSTSGTILSSAESLRVHSSLDQDITSLRAPLPTLESVLVFSFEAEFPSYCKPVRTSIVPHVAGLIACSTLGATRALDQTTAVLTLVSAKRFTSKRIVRCG